MNNTYIYKTTENYKITNERKFWTQEIPRKENLGPRYIHKKKYETHEIPTKS